ncbi:helix-turn-helix transcriptional regulator [Yoonia sp. 208BN28-4]|uniref:helix-turn-helix transcriptional regulator n=1 Tax=Yoonia sp. 208BN28-4 TaxID=3126505 RepID=UPI0030A242C9
MSLATEHLATPLSLTGIAYSQQNGRWRTEAMRSHATPRLIHITKGQGRITVAGLTRGYGPNNLIFIPAHVMYGFEVGPTVVGQILTIPAAMAPEWPDTPVHMRLRDVTQQQEASTLFEGLEREIKSSRNAHSRAAHYHLGILSVFFERQLEDQPADPNAQRAETSAARLVAAYSDLIERDYRSQKGVADFAAELGVTPTHLTRCCKQSCGKSALALLRNRVHYEACVMLRDTRIPVRDIASALGFRSAAYFTRSFQAHAGLTPSTFRKHGACAARQG